MEKGGAERPTGPFLALGPGGQGRATRSQARGVFLSLLVKRTTRESSGQGVSATPCTPGKQPQGAPAGRESLLPSHTSGQRPFPPLGRRAPLGREVVWRVAQGGLGLAGRSPAAGGSARPCPAALCCTTPTPVPRRGPCGRHRPRVCPHTRRARHRLVGSQPAESRLKHPCVCARARLLCRP